jgi:hypothetical protein
LHFNFQVLEFGLETALSGLFVKERSMRALLSPSYVLFSVDLYAFRTALLLAL